MARVCLIYFDFTSDHFPGFHHGLASIIGALKSNNHGVSFIHLIDETNFTAEMKVSIDKEAYDLIGLSFTTSQKRNVRRFLDLVKLDTRLVIAGGVHTTLVKEDIFEDFPEVNGICIGEGEIPLVELCRRMDATEDYLNIPSFYFNTERGIKKNPISPLPDINTLPIPDYSLFDYERIVEKGGGVFSMMLGRGCPFDCSYCSNHAIREVYPNKNKYVRLPSVRHSINMIKNNLTLYPNTEAILFADDTFTLNKRWLSEFCDIYNKEVSIPFICNARVETIDEMVVKSLKRAGCAYIYFGIESGNEWLRRFILNRRYSNDEVKRAFDMAKHHKIKCFSYNMAGLPFETASMAKETLDLNVAIQPSRGLCFYFYPFPGTELYQICRKYDLFSSNWETVAGFFESPSIKGVFMQREEMIKHFELMNVFFRLQAFFARMKIPSLFRKPIVKIAFPLRKPILGFLNPKNMRAISLLRRTIRKYALKKLSSFSK